MPYKFFESFHILIQEADHLGSLLTLTNTSGTVVTEHNFDAWGRNRNPANWTYGNIPTNPTWLYRGYTGHEHVKEFALINMNGRMYDPVTCRMLSPDNYVPLPWNTQGYNRYGYANNNPLIYTDPDGNFFFVPLLLQVAKSAAMGAFIGGMRAEEQGKSFFSGAWKGAVSGGLGGAFGFFAPVGFLPGMAYGAAAGAATGAIMSAVNGGNIWKGLSGGAALGGISGGIAGGIEASNFGADIWTGYRAPHDFEFGADYITGSFNKDELPYNDETLRKFKNANFNTVQGPDNTSMRWRPKGYTSDGYYFYNKSNVRVGASTIYRTWKHGTSSIYFSKAAFHSPETMFIIMGHELGHLQSYFRLGALYDEFGDEDQHQPILNWQYNAARVNGWKSFEFQMEPKFNIYNVDPDLNFLTLPYKLINRHPR